MKDNYLENELKRMKKLGLEQYRIERIDKEAATPVWKRGGGGQQFIFGKGGIISNELWCI